MLNEDELEQAIGKFMNRKAHDHPWLAKRKRSVLRHIVSNHQFTRHNRPGRKAGESRKAWLNRTRLAT